MLLFSSTVSVLINEVGGFKNIPNSNTFEQTRKSKEKQSLKTC